MSRTYLLIGGNSGIGQAFLDQELEKGHRIIACSENQTPLFRIRN